VIQNDDSNQYSATTIVAPITSTVRMPLAPVHTILAADTATGLSVVSVALLNQIRTVDRRRLVKRLGAADTQTMEQVDQAIKISLDIYETL
jgi:mRNA interferase MazF